MKCIILCKSAANVMRSATKIRTGLTAGEIKQAFRDNRYTC